MLVVGDAHTLKVHVHTDDPERPPRSSPSTGEVSHLDVADMREQVAERAERLADARPCRAPAARSPSSPATGMAELFERLGAMPLDGGPTLNPSTYELLAGIHAVPAEEVVVLPNSPTCIMAAERAAELSEKAVRVVPPARRRRASPPPWRSTRARGADDERRGDARGARARAHRRRHRRRARRRRRALRAGDAVGFVDDQLVAWGEPAATLRAVLAALAAAPSC